MKKKLIKSLLPIASCVAVVAPITCLTSCAEDEDVDEWDAGNNGLHSDFLQIPSGNKRFKFEIEYDDGQPRTIPGTSLPTGEFCLVPGQTASEIQYEFQVNKITLNRQKLSAGADYTISDNKKTISLNQQIVSSLFPASKINIDVTIETTSPLGVAFASLGTTPEK